MSEGAQGFFNIEVTDQFVEELDDSTFSELFEILKENFFNELKTYTNEKAEVESIKQEIESGKKNIESLNRIQVDHLAKKEKYEEANQKLTNKISKLKEQLCKIQ